MRLRQARSDKTRARLLRAAEKLFAVEGIDAVSMRRISETAGQRNNSALQYHFGTRTALMSALLASRMQRINQRRASLLEVLRDESGAPELPQLVAVLVVPLVEQLLDGKRGSYYVRVVGQVFAVGEAAAVLGPAQPSNEAFYTTLALIRTAIPEVPRRVLNERFLFMAGHMVQATAAVQHQLRGLSPRALRAKVQAFANELTDYLAGALRAPSHRAASALTSLEETRSKR